MVVYNDRNFFGRFEYRFSSPPSQGGETGSTPVVAIEELHQNWLKFFLFIVGTCYEDGVEPRSERRPRGVKGGMDAAESERRRAGIVAHDVRSWKPSTPVVAIEENLGAGRDFFVLR